MSFFYDLKLGFAFENRQKVTLVIFHLAMIILPVPIKHKPYYSHSADNLFQDFIDSRKPM